MNIRRTPCFLLFLLSLLVLAQPARSQTDQDCTANESWINAGTGLPGEAIASSEMDDRLYVLHRDGPQENALYQISTWDGSVWSPVTTFDMRFVGENGEPDFREGPVNCFQALNGSIYMSGQFVTINNDENLEGFVRWDGSAWSPAGGSRRLKIISALGVHNGSLFASAFVQTGIIDEWQKKYDWHILQFDGTDWIYPGGDTVQHNFPTRITTFLSWNGDLYAGGESFRSPSETPAWVVRWNGTEWTSLGRTLTTHNEAAADGGVYNLFVHNNQLYISGYWQWYAGTQKCGLARWTGSVWSTDVPQPNSLDIRSQLVMYGNRFYRISSMNSYGFPGDSRGDTRKYVSIERFDGAAWHVVSNVDGHINTIVPFKEDLLIGGKFQESCGTPLSNFARLSDNPSLGVDPDGNASMLAVYPNPVRNELHLNGEMKSGSVVTLRNLLGQEIARYHHDGTQRMTIDASGLPSGAYLLEVETAGGMVVKSVSVIR